MKKVMFALLAVTLLSGLSFAAGPDGSMSARSASVTLKAIVPEYLALNVVNAEPVMFDFRGKENAMHISAGWHNPVASLTNPSWGLAYNLRINRTITVCAYATDFQGTTSGTTAVIPVTYLSGTNLQGGTMRFGVVADCSVMPGAILLDKISGANATSTGNRFGVDRPEGFSSMTLIPSAAGDYVPTPDTYRGRLMIVAQAI